MQPTLERAPDNSIVRQSDQVNFYLADGTRLVVRHLGDRIYIMNTGEAGDPYLAVQPGSSNTVTVHPAGD